jgi:hypothetical protein
MIYIRKITRDMARLDDVKVSSRYHRAEGPIELPVQGTKNFDKYFLIGITVWKEL